VPSRVSTIGRLRLRDDGTVFVSGGDQKDKFSCRLNSLSQVN